MASSLRLPAINHLSRVPRGRKEKRRRNYEGCGSVFQRFSILKFELARNKDEERERESVFETMHRVVFPLERCANNSEIGLEVGKRSRRIARRRGEVMNDGKLISTPFIREREEDTSG